MARKTECPIIPTADRIVVVRDESLAVTEGGIELPSASVEDKTQGVVVVVGPEAHAVLAGDHIVFGSYAGTEVEWAGKWLVMSEEDVVCILKGKGS